MKVKAKVEKHESQICDAEIQSVDRALKRVDRLCQSHPYTGEGDPNEQQFALAVKHARDGMLMARQHLHDALGATLVMGRCMRTGFFVLEECDKQFKGYTYGDHWNGFATPCFEKAEAEAIVEVLKTQGYEVCFEDDTYIISHPDDEDAASEFKGEDITYKGQTLHVYWIGAWEWTWHEELEHTAGGAK